MTSELAQAIANYSERPNLSPMLSNELIQEREKAVAAGFGIAFDFGSEAWQMHNESAFAGKEPEFNPPRIECCDSARATGGAYHAPDCASYQDEPIT
jgi:hypothetical protein